MLAVVRYRRHLHLFSVFLFVLLRRVNLNLHQCQNSRAKTRSCYCTVLHKYTLLHELVQPHRKAFGHIAIAICPSLKHGQDCEPAWLSAYSSCMSAGMPTIIWQGKVFAAAAVVKRPQDTLMLECKLGVQRATWPSGLEQGWGQHLVGTPPRLIISIILSVM